ncbi:MAG: hypothetical protein V3V06_01475, partial [Dehalococcoidia bacterium]
MPDPAIPESVLRQFYAYDRDLPLDPQTRVVQESETMRVERFEITSRHEERVPGLILRDPQADGARPAVLLAHPATLDKGSDYILWPAQEWVGRGLVCVSIDQAAHGERAKRPHNMEDFFRHPQRQADETIQTAVDWMRVLDYLEGREEVDASRIAFVGFSLGGRRGAPFVGLDARVRAAAFCITGVATKTPSDETARLAQAITDPLTFAPYMSGRATLIVAGRRDDIAPPQA